MSAGEWDGFHTAWSISWCSIVSQALSAFILFICGPDLHSFGWMGRPGPKLTHGVIQTTADGKDGRDERG